VMILAGGSMGMSGKKTDYWRWPKTVLIVLFRRIGKRHEKCTLKKCRRQSFFGSAGQINHIYPGGILMSTKSTIGYQIDTDEFQKLQYINKQLFGDGTHLTPDNRRDLANMMFSVLKRIENWPIYDE